MNRSSSNNYSARNYESATHSLKISSTVNYSPVVKHESTVFYKTVLTNPHSGREKIQTASTFRSNIHKQKLLDNFDTIQLQDPSPKRQNKSSLSSKLVPELSFRKIEKLSLLDSRPRTTQFRSSRTSPQSRLLDSDMYRGIAHNGSEHNTRENSPRIIEKNDLDYVKQEDSIRKNPHFHRFYKSVDMLNRVEAIKVPLPKDFFWTSDQTEINKRMTMMVKEDQTYAKQLHIKILREGERELIELPKGATRYFKIRAENKLFPLDFTIRGRAGAFEALIFKNESTIINKDYDFIFISDEFRVHYDIYDHIKSLYLSITASEGLKMYLTVNFTQGAEPKKKILTTLAFSELYSRPQTTSQKKKNIYEFFRKDMRHEESEEFKDMIEDIKKEKKQRAQSLSNNKDLVKENINSTAEFRNRRTMDFQRTMMKRETSLKRAAEKKLTTQIEKGKHTVVNFYKRSLKNMEIRWTGEKDKERRELYERQKEWLMSLVLVRLASSILEKKRSRVIVRIFEKAREIKITKIQRAYRKLGEAPVLKEIRDKLNLSSLSARISIQMFLALNSLALTCKKTKETKAANLAAFALREAGLASEMVRCANIYMSIIVEVQRRWRIKMDVFNARVELFKAHWDSFCISILSKESKKKKKKYSEIIPLIKDPLVKAHAKKYIQDKMTQHIRQLRDYHTKTNLDNSEEDYNSSFEKQPNYTSQIDAVGVINPALAKIKTELIRDETKKQSRIIVARRNDRSKTSSTLIRNRLMKNLHTHNAVSKPKLKIKPTSEELLEILIKISEELKHQPVV